MSVGREEREALKLLRRTIPIGYDRISSVLMDTSLSVMNLLADKKCGPKERRIGVFGPYPNGGREIIDSTAKMVCELGFIAITADGFYLPNQCDIFHNIDEIMPSPIHKVKSMLPGRIFFHHFPRLVEKAIFYENDERGQVAELYGCHAFYIPCLGFIIHDKFWNENNCIFLSFKDVYSICETVSEELCYHDLLRPFCPFYESINIPWFSKELFLTDENQLVATKNLEDLKPALEEFVSN